MVSNVGVGSASSAAPTDAVTSTAATTSEACAMRELSVSPDPPEASVSVTLSESSVTTLMRHTPTVGAAYSTVRAYCVSAASVEGPAAAPRRTKPAPSRRVA